MRGILSALAILSCICAAAQPRTKLDRGFEAEKHTVVAAKGTWMVGGTANFSTHKNNEYDLAVVIKGVNSNGYSISASPEACWFFARNIGLGFRFDYDRGLLDIPSASAGIGDISLSIKDYNLLRQTFSETIFVRALLPLGRSGRLAMYVDMGLRAQQGQEKVVDAHTGFREGTWKEVYGGGLVVRPGLTAFLTKRMAICAGVGMAGIGVKSSRQLHNQVDEGRTTQFTATYMLDLTALSVGLNFYL